MRPCRHSNDRLPIPGIPYASGQCRICWLEVNDRRFATLLATKKTTVATRLTASGPGAELAAILASLGITSEKGCGCAQKAAQMNALGIEGCIAHRDEIADWLREQLQRLGWAEKLQAAARAIWQRLILDPLDPAPGLVAEAIRRAQAKTSLLTTTGELHAKRE